MYLIQIIASKVELYKPLKEAVDELNEVQNVFNFKFVEPDIQNAGTVLTQSAYHTDLLFEWLKKFRITHKGDRRYLILAVDVPIDGQQWHNLFGNFSAKDGLAIFTTHRFNQFVNDQPRYCTYYLIRYALSFLAPTIKSHSSVEHEDGCMFDNKVDKKLLLRSMNSGRICDACRGQLQEYLNPTIQKAIEDMLKLVSGKLAQALIMKGGGVKGLAYASALEVLGDYFSFDVFVGTSAGAIAAVMLGADYKPMEIRKIFYDLNFSSFKDAGKFKRWINAFQKKGFYPGKHLENTIERLIKDKTNRDLIPMSDLPGHTIMYATQKGIGTVTFDTMGDSKETPASFATRCSMSIPGFFISPQLNGGAVFDGGLKNNFPTTKFKKAYPTKPFIGLYLFTPRNPAQGLGWQIVDILTDAEDQEIYKDHKNRIVLINTGPIGTTDFDLTIAKKDFLLASGKLAAVEFIKENYPDKDISSYNIDALKMEFERTLALINQPINENEDEDDFAIF